MREVRWARLGQGGEGPGQLVMVLVFPEQGRFQHGLGQLFDKQGHPIGFRHDLPQVFGVELGREGRGAHQITEHDRELAPFGVWW